MNILSIQSWVAYGHVGNAAALFALQRLGAEVWGVHTVQFSNHPGYGGFTGQRFDGAMIGALVDGLAARGVLAQTDAVLSGYLGDAASGAAVLEAVARARMARPEGLYACDPVMGDRGSGLYVDPGIADWMRARAITAADIITPNQFELERLAGAAAPGGVGGGAAGLAAVAGWAHALRARMRPSGPRLVLVTSVEAAETPADAIDLLLACDQGTALLRTPRLDLAANGAGDLIAALFLLHVLRLGDPLQALQRATASVFGVLCQTLAAGVRELRLVQAQEELVSPSRQFDVTLLPGPSGHG